MKNFVKQFLPLWSAAFVGGFAIGVGAFIWAYLSVT